MTDQPALTPAVRAGMQGLLRGTTILLRDMSRSRRKGVFYLAEVIIETRVVADYLDGKPSNVSKCASVGGVFVTLKMAVPSSTSSNIAT